MPYTLEVSRELDSRDCISRSAETAKLTQPEEPDHSHPRPAREEVHHSYSNRCDHRGQGDRELWAAALESRLNTPQNFHPAHRCHLDGLFGHLKDKQKESTWPTEMPSRRDADAIAGA